MNNRTLTKPKNNNSTTFSPVFEKKLPGNTIIPGTGNEIRDTHQPEFGHNFSKIQLESPAFHQSCPFSLSGPGLYPYGGACHTCAPTIQAKLKIGQPNDKYEQEADRVAEQVMRMPDPQIQRKGCLACNEKDEDEQIQAMPIADQITPLVQRQVEEEEEEEEVIQTKEVSGQTPGVGRNKQMDINNLRGTGTPLTESTRSYFEPRFGHDFSNVRVHDDSLSNKSAKSINAKAYTVDSDIIFSTGQYAPEMSEGRKLLAHELTHVMQQSAGIRRQPFKNRPEYWASIPIDYEMIPDPMIRMQIMRADYEKHRWKNALERLKKGELDDNDLKYPSLRNRLTGLKTVEISKLISKIKAFQKQRDNDISDPKVIDTEKKRPITTAKIIQWLEVRKEISTPMPDNATVNSMLPGMIDSYSISFNDIVITVMPDTHGAVQNTTTPTANFTGRFTWRVVGGKITDLKKDRIAFNPTKLEVTILTRYKDSPDDTSGYGKGTTHSDKYNKTTTLRVHEGQHGTDFISYLKNNSLPVRLNNGINGQLTPAQFSKILKYIKNITKDTCETTDQTGFSQDEFLKTPQGKASGIVSCRKP